MKKIIKFLPLLLPFFVFNSATSVYASDFPDEGATKNYSNCSSVDTSSQYNTDNPSFSSSYYYQQYSKNYRFEPLYNEDGTPKMDANGMYQLTKKVEIQGTWYTKYGSCSVSKTLVSNDKTSAAKQEYKIYVSHPVINHNYTTYANVFWDKEVDVTFKYKGQTYGSGTISGGTVTGGLSPNSSTLDNYRTSSVTTYVDKDMPIPKCVITRGDGTTSNCSVKRTVDKSLNSKLRLICMKYESSKTGDGDAVCFERAYVTHVEFTDKPSKVYPGFEFRFGCKAYMGDGLIRYLNENFDNIDGLTMDYVFLMHAVDDKGYFIGTFAEKYPYKRLGKNNTMEKLIPTEKNYFQSYDTRNNEKYDVYCSYYSTVEHIRQFDKASGSNYDRVNGEISFSNATSKDSDAASNGEKYNETKSEKTTVTNIGLSKIDLEVTGGFGDYKKEDSTYKIKEETLKVGSKNGDSYRLTPERKFIAGHFYDFNLYATFSDGQVADVTSNPFSTFNTNTWFKGKNLFSVESDFYSGFPYSGSKHRIPYNLEKTLVADRTQRVSTQFLNDDSAIGTKGDKKTFIDVSFETREIIHAHLYEKQDNGEFTSLDENKLSRIGESDKKIRNIAFRVTYNDGEIENWTNSDSYTGKLRTENTDLYWNRDFITGKTNETKTFDFSKVKGDSRELTAFATYFNRYDLKFKYIRGMDNKPLFSSSIDGAKSGVGSTPQFGLHAKVANNKTYNQNEGPNFEGYHAFQRFNLTNCNTSELAFACDATDNNGYKAIDYTPKITTADQASVNKYYNMRDSMPDSLKSDLISQKPFKLTYQTSDNKFVLPQDETIELANDPKKKERSMFYDIRYFPVSGTSGSVGDN